MRLQSLLAIWAMSVAAFVTVAVIVTPAALSTTTLWNVNQTTGNDNNGCLFTSQQSGTTNYSLNSTPHLTLVASSPGSGQATAQVGTTNTQLVFTGGSDTTSASDLGNSANIPSGITGIQPVPTS